MVSQAPSTKTPVPPKVAAIPTKKGWREQLKLLALLNKTANLTVDFKKPKQPSKLKQKNSTSTVRYDVVQFPKSEPVSLPVTTMQPPPPEHEVECSTPVASVPLVDVPQVVLTPVQHSTATADVSVETEMLVHSVSGLGLAKVEEPK